jgi:nucleolar protein 58
MLLLLETPGGYALFKKKKEHINSKNLSSFNLFSFYEYNSKIEAYKSIESLKNIQIPKNLKQFLKNSSKKEQSLIINCANLKGNLAKKIGPFFKRILVKKKIFRKLRNDINKDDNLKTFFEKKKILTLSHNSRIDKTVIYSIKLLDELEKEINIYSQKLKEWYSWHFPELFSIISDNLIYAKVISRIETREKLSVTDLSDFLPVSLIEKIMEVSEISLGVSIHEDDLACILSLCSQIIAFSIFKKQLQSYLKNRMYIIAPNLTAITGERVGARLILHSGSLLSLAKSYSSKVQILGAEKALFRSIKTKTHSPKYGIIYNINCINKADKKIKGKISRILSGKIVLSARIDALGNSTYGGSIGVKSRFLIEKKIKQLNSFLEKYHKVS